MFIARIEIDGIGSFQNFEIKFDKNKNMIVGTNGVGKTNFMKILASIINNIESMGEINFNLESHQICHVKIEFRFTDKEKEKLKKIIAYVLLIHIAKQNALTIKNFYDIDEFYELIMNKELNILNGG